MQKIMKRIAAFMLAAMMVASMSACNRQSEEEPGSSASSGTSSSASSTKSSSKGKDDYKPTVPDVADKMKAAKEKNADVVGWLQIPNTTIDEAVVQTTDNDFYLRKDVEKNYAYEGCYYVDYESELKNNGKDLPQNTIIYGHNLGTPMGVKDDPEGVKFAQLLKFNEEKFAKENPYIYFTTEGAQHIFEIFAVAYCEPTTSPVPYHMASYDEDKFLRLVDDMMDRSLWTYEVPFSEDDKIITLSTCTYKYGTYNQNPNQRFVVFGKLVKDGESFHKEANLKPNAKIKEPNFG